MTKQPRTKKKHTAPKRNTESATPDSKPAGNKPRALDYTSPDFFLFPGTENDWSADDPDKPLTHQQWALVTEYMLDFNAKAAMGRAGYVDATHTARLTQAPNIRKHLARVLAERYRANVLVANKLLANIVDIVDANLGDFLDWEGHTIKLKPASEIPPEKRALLAELKQGERGGFSIKLHDKLSAIDNAMRHLGMYDKNRQATSRPADVTRTTLKAVQDGTMTVDDALLSLDMEGIPIPESLRILAARQKKEDDGPKDDGSYSVTSEEEMAERAASRRKAIEDQRKTFVPQRQSEVLAIKEELGNGSFVPGGE